MSSKSTPGPWTLSGEYMTRYVYARGEKISGVVAVVNLAWPGKEQQDEQRANAHLIASAPELLESLKDAYPYIDNPHLRLRIGAVIAKAMGIA